MNEPDLGAAVIYVALISAILFFPAVAVTWFARRFDVAAWRRFSATVFALTLVAVVVSLSIGHSPEARLTRAAILSLSVSTAAATWIAGRMLQHDDGVSFARLLAATIVVQLAVGFTVVTTSC